MASIALGIAGLVGAGTSLAGSIIGSNAAQTAASQQATQAQAGLAFQEQVWNQQQQNQQPFLSAGQQSIAQLTQALQNGTYGPGSLTAPTLSAAPTFSGAPPAAFTAPTAQQAAQTPGYQFELQQGTNALMRQQAATGGGVGGGTLKSLERFGTNLADTTYNDVFNRSLSTYQAGLQGYGAQLQGYGAQLQGWQAGTNAQLAQFQAQEQAQAQGFQELAAPAHIGEGSAVNLGQSGQAASVNVGNLMGTLGNAQAAGTVGSANALMNGITGAGNNVSQSLLLQMLMGGGFSGGGSAAGNAMTSQSNSFAQDILNSGYGAADPSTYGATP